MYECVCVCVWDIIATSIHGPFPQQQNSKIRIECEKKAAAAATKDRLLVYASLYVCVDMLLTRHIHPSSSSPNQTEKHTHSPNGWYATSIEIKKTHLIATEHQNGKSKQYHDSKYQLYWNLKFNRIRIRIALHCIFISILSFLLWIKIRHLKWTKSKIYACCVAWK